MGGNTSGDTSTQKNIFNGNKLPENYIFPPVEVSPLVASSKMARTQLEGRMASHNRVKPDLPPTRQNLPTHPLTTIFKSKNKYFCMFACLNLDQSKTFTLANSYSILGQSKTFTFEHLPANRR